MKEAIIINEVGLRDGLQNQPVPISTADKLRLAESLVNAGVRYFEPVSYAHPKAVPQMADASALAKQLPWRDDLHYTAMVPNMKGYERAREDGFGCVALLLSTTDSFNQRNLNMSRDQAMQSCVDIIARARADGVRTRAYVAGALACPYDGPVAPAETIALAQHLFAAGADEIGIADTIGGGHPLQLQQVLRPLIRDMGADNLLVHLHDTRGLALAMAWTACDLGIRRFDAAIGGLGGCPFAPGATGNVATEDLVNLFEQSGLDTGISLQALREAAALAASITKTAAGGRIFQWADSQARRGVTLDLDTLPR